MTQPAARSQTSDGRSMNSQHDTLKAFTDAAADAVAREIASLRREAQRERELRDAEHRARMSDLDVRLAAVAALERKVEDRLASLKDGAPGVSVSLNDVAPLVIAECERLFAGMPKPKDGEPGQVDMVAVEAAIKNKVKEVVALLPTPRDGADADPATIERMVKEAMAALPPPPAGKDADPDIVRLMVDEAVAALPPPAKGERGADGAPGKLPVVREWSDRVYYEGEVVAFQGSTYQANKDTGRAPPHDDWTCIASAGRNGADGLVPTICGTYNVDADYKALDIVALNGASFAARRDHPGVCPGDGWQLIAARGKSGPPGEGRRGEPGKAGPALTNADIDDEGMLTLKSADGSVVTCDLYPLLQKVSR